jgi:hypothetical protein
MHDKNSIKKRMYNKEIQEVTKIRLTSLHIPLIGACARRLLDSLFVNYFF